jgi:hypothetical protein
MNDDDLVCDRLLPGTRLRPAVSFKFNLVGLSNRRHQDFAKQTRSEASPAVLPWNNDWLLLRFRGQDGGGFVD